MTIEQPPQKNLGRLAISADVKRPRRMGLAGKLAVLALVLAGAVGVVIWRDPSGSGIKRAGTAAAEKFGGAASAPENTPPPTPPASPVDPNVVLTASGYIVAHERIAISPRIQNTVKWLGVKKGDRVKKDQVIVLLDDTEYKARLEEYKAQLSVAKARHETAKRNFLRIQALQAKDLDTRQNLDDALKERDMAAAQMEVAQAGINLAGVYLEWCTVRSPIDGVILEKLTHEGELVSPQTFGGTKGPSTSLVAIADLNDLQVEIDVNEADVSKIRIGQSCMVNPEAYPDRKYKGSVAEISPEANRQKGTLQIKVQIHQPDEFLTPELTAKVNFLK
ncbi:MAG: efflux RND transporter periplasmic adaptor subunit [Verrucomicrobiae bacterium]|nr:efflux RND transporter periplasmic adaptor subunit [Verrucomicrobiae bacterium]